MYHRIAEGAVDPLQLAVSPANFVEQLSLISRTRYPVGLSEFARRLVAGSLPNNAIALTFDDGYVDNLSDGLPKLVAGDVPATVFLTTDSLDQSKPFWWDELAQIIFERIAAREIELIVRGTKTRFELDHVSWKTAHPTPYSEKRQRTFLDLWQSMRLFSVDEREAVMAQLRSEFSVPYACNKQGRAMSSNEVQKLAADGLVEIGAHTASHPMLSRLSRRACEREIVQSKLVCEALAKAPISSFAYPYGDFGDTTRDVVVAAGFALACSTRPGAVSASADIFALPRIHVPDLNGDKFEEMLHRTSICR